MYPLGFVVATWQRQSPHIAIFTLLGSLLNLTASTDDDMIVVLYIAASGSDSERFGPLALGEARTAEDADFAIGLAEFWLG